MGSAYRSHTTVASGTRSNTTFTAPSGIVNGDILVILMSCGNSPAVSVTGPSGFTPLTGFGSGTDVSFDGTFHLRMYGFYKVASGESGDYATSHASATTEGIMYAVSGGSQSSPIDPNPTVTAHPSGSGGSTLIAPSITTQVNDSWIGWFGCSWDAFGSQSPSSGTTPTFTERFNPAAGGVYAQDGVMTALGSTGDKSVTCSQAADRVWIAGMVVVEADTTPVGVGVSNIRVAGS